MKGWIPAELLKALGTKGTMELYDICNETYVSDERPNDFLYSVIMPIENKKHSCRRQTWLEKQLIIWTVEFQ